MKYISNYFIEQNMHKERLQAKEEVAEDKATNIKDSANKNIEKQREIIRRVDESLDKEKERIEIERDRLKTKEQETQE